MVHNNKLSSYFIQQIHADKDVDLVFVLEEMCGHFGFTNATYFGFGLHGTELGEDILITTYDTSWISRYLDQEYKYIDPIISLASQSLLPVDWSDISKSSRPVKLFFGEAGEFGVGKSGLTIPVRGLYGDTALFSINSTAEGQKWQLYKSNILPDLTYLAHLFHHEVLAKRGVKSPCEEHRLTRREQDVLRWAAKGKTAWETAKILNLSEKTVSFYISNVNFKLDVATKTQAVAKAISERLLLL